MPLTWKDRIKVAVASGGTGTLTLGSAASGYQTFAAGDDAKLFPYVIENGTAWESGYGTYTHSGTTFARTTRTDSSSGAAIDAGTGYLYVDLVAGVADRTNLGVLENVTGSDAATTMAVGNMYVVDMSAWATADRTYTLPTTAAVGSRIGILISSGNTSTFELDITAATSDTLNGVAGGTVWSRLFITGECVIMRCVTADSAWIVEYDGRIPMKAMMSAASSQTGIVTSTETTVTKGATGSWSEDVNIGSIIDAANNAIKVRRACKALFSGNFPFQSLNDQVQCYAAVRVNSGTARRFVRGATSHTGTNIWSGSGSVQLVLAAGDSVTMRVLHNHGSDASSEWISGSSQAFLSILEVF